MPLEPSTAREHSASGPSHQPSIPTSKRHIPTNKPHPTPPPLFDAGASIHLPLQPSRPHVTACPRVPPPLHALRERHPAPCALPARPSTSACNTLICTSCCGVGRCKGWRRPIKKGWGGWCAGGYSIRRGERRGGGGTRAGVLATAKGRCAGRAGQELQLAARLQCSSARGRMQQPAVPLLHKAPRRPTHACCELGCCELAVAALPKLCSRPELGLALGQQVLHLNLVDLRGTRVACGEKVCAVAGAAADAASCRRLHDASSL